MGHEKQHKNTTSLTHNHEANLVPLLPNFCPCEPPTPAFRLAISPCSGASGGACRLLQLAVTVWYSFTYRGVFRGSGKRPVKDWVDSFNEPKIVDGKESVLHLLLFLFKSRNGGPDSPFACP